MFLGTEKASFCDSPVRYGDHGPPLDSGNQYETVVESRWLMNSAKIGGLAFSLLFGGALLGMYFSRFLPTEHLIGVQMGIGLLTAMFALLLSLQLSAGKTYFDTQEQDVTLFASRTILLDSVLAHYGPEAREAREVLRDNVADFLTRVWPKESSTASTWTPKDGIGIYDKVQKLSPKDDDQRSKRTVALGMVTDLSRISWTTAARIRSSTAIPLMMGDHYFC